jgi:hypothetical protein
MERKSQRPLREKDKRLAYAHYYIASRSIIKGEQTVWEPPDYETFKGDES